MAELASPSSRVTSRARLFWPLILLTALALVLAILLAVAVGAVPLPFSRVARIVLFHLAPGLITVDWTPVDDQIVWMFRLPRVLLAAVVGAALSVAGATL